LDESVSTLWNRLGQVRRLLSSRPAEVYHKVRGELELGADRFRRRPTYSSLPWEAALARLEACLATELTSYLQEPGLADLESETRDRIKQIRRPAPFPLHLSADVAVARSAYAICRALRPTVVLETGVGYGLTSSFILQALSLNRHGHLSSVDLPPLWRNAESFIGCLVPDHLRSRWTLHRGASRRLLQRTLSLLGPVDLFIHDSLHSFSNMQAEFRAVTPALAPRAVVIADDIEGNGAFTDWVANSKPTCAMAVRGRDKPSLFGVAVFS
jgi:predicted O-methyltransferase YrrM